MVYFPQGALVEYDMQVVERISPRDVAIDRILGGEAKYGKLHLREDRIDILEQWMAPKPFFDYVPVQESIGIMIPVEGRHHIGNIAGVTLAHSWIELNMRDIGKYLSLHENFRQHLINYMKSDEGRALAAALNKAGYRAEDIHYTAVGFVPKDAIYAIGRLGNGKVVIYANKDSYRMLERGAKAERMDIKELIEVAIAEEFTHNFRRSYDRGGIPEEEATKIDLLEFYSDLADRTSDPKLKGKYERIARHLEWDIETIGRYAKVDSGKLEQMLEEEALKNGINTKEGIAEYKSARLSELAEAAKEIKALDYKGEKAAEAEDGAESEGISVAAKEGSSEGGEAGGEGGGEGGGGE